MLFHWMHRAIYCLAILIVGSLYAESDYIICIEGGGSKTILQVIDKEGQVVPLFRNAVKESQIVGGGSNINTVGVEGIRELFRFLFEEVFIDEEDHSLSAISSQCRVVAGMAGIGVEHNKQKVAELLSEWGISRDRLVLMSDAEMALHLVEGDGIILISGTGSICLGKKNGALFRVGGLGRILGDEGSGYQIGLQAIKAALAEEYGWGVATSLTAELKGFFGVTEMRTMIPQINQGILTPAQIASCAPIVFNKAYEGDRAAGEIIQHAAEDLGALLDALIKLSGLCSGHVHLWGGVFKNAEEDRLIQVIREQISESRDHFQFINQSNNNPAVLFAVQYFLRS
ncbi:MAG: hypothetical protein JSR93_04870 [Verrucomicrobia bacterium]|nr:hypothetical protein [Verrucomicrobiota bacterium]